MTSLNEAVTAPIGVSRDVMPLFGNPATLSSHSRT